MSLPTITPKQLFERRSSVREVRLLPGIAGGWHVDVWIGSDADSDASQLSGAFLASDRQPARARLFRTADAALRVLAGVGFDRLVVARTDRG